MHLWHAGSKLGGIHAEDISDRSDIYLAIANLACKCNCL